MNITTMQMAPDEARRHYLEYRKKVREHREARGRQLSGDAVKATVVMTTEMKRIREESIRLAKEDEQLRVAYRAMSLGQRIISLSSVLKSAGLNEKKLPCLAICPAGAKWCYLSRTSDGFQFSRVERWSKKADQVVVPHSTFPAELNEWSWRRKYGFPDLPQKALVPAIPAHFRPAGDLDGYYILWEAVWENAAPADPLLLKRLGDNTYAVMAQWDLSPIERAVLEGRLT